jgi:isopenicillin-N N-acyltransferase like protein
MFPLIELTGDARTRGLQYGTQAADRIRRSVSFYAGQLEAMTLARQEVRGLVETFLLKVEGFEPLYIEEMRGIAEGARVDLQDIVMVNARTEILRLGRQQAESRALDLTPDGCTGAVVMPDMSRTGRLLHGQNWDWKAECAETGVVLKIRRDDGPDILTFTEAGGLARSGLNSAGIAITANYLACDRDFGQIGIPLSLLRRKALETPHLALALQTIYCTPKSASNNLMMSHAGGIALDIECAPDESFLVYPSGGLLVHANHWQSPVALQKLRETGIPRSPDSLYRDLRVRNALARLPGKVELDTLRTAFFDDFASPWSVCRPPRLKSDNELSATVAMILMDPAIGLMEVAPLPAVNKTFATYRLEMDRAFTQPPVATAA